MGKIKGLLSKKSIKTTFMFYVLMYILLSFSSSLLFSNSLQSMQERIRKRHLEKFYDSFDEIDREEIEFYNNYASEYYIPNITSYYTPAELWLYNSINFLTFAVYPLCFIVGILITSTLFYRRQLKVPLAILEDAADKIANENLDFSIAFQKENEFGKLCRSFEKMRVALRDNNLELWRQVEERKRLNAAFAHDLRTPLTVLKGQSELLANYAPNMSDEKIIAAANRMGRHIARLEEYVNTMNELQCLEEIEIRRQSVDAKDLLGQLRLIGTSVCKDRELLFSFQTENMPWPMLDLSVVLQVYENLLANAARYAASKVTVTIELQNNSLSLAVSDDGDGFAAKDLTDATKPFYKASSETNNGHLGMGLHICHILCEKHGGSLTLSNQDGACVVAVFR